MAVLLFTVEGVFELKGRGVVLTGYASRPEQPRPKAGQSIELRLPGGTTLFTRIQDVEPRFCEGVNRAILLSPDNPRDGVVAGTEVWEGD
jgi:hypothetical protein